MNNQVSSRTGFTPTQLFLGRPGFNFEFPARAKEILKLMNGSLSKNRSPIYADHYWKRKEVRRIVPRTAKEKKLSTKLVTAFWYIIQDSRHGRVTRWTALTSDHFWSRM